MRRRILLTVTIFFGLGLSLLIAQSPLADAFNYLNAVRANPASYSTEIGISLSGIQPMPALRWNSKLYDAAMRKAEDMAKRNYYGHIDPDGYGMNAYIQQYGYSLNTLWLDKISNNYFESVSAGQTSPLAAIIGLINDQNQPDHSRAGHRQHLLGIGDFYKTCYDIGIGWAYNENSTYKYYYCVLIAKHDF